MGISYKHHQYSLQIPTKPPQFHLNLNTASKDIRGTLGSLLQLMVTIGILFVYVVGHFTSLQTVNIICGTLPIVFFALFIWMPETPYYHIMQNRTEYAENALKRLRGAQYDYKTELTAIQTEHDQMKQNQQNSWLSVFRRGTSRRALMITVVLLSLAQSCGINAVIFYTGFIFESAKTGIDATLATIVVGVMQVCATFVASLAVDRLGRRFLLITSATILALCNMSLGAYFYLLDHHSHSPLVQQLKWLPIASLCMYIIAFSLGLGYVYAIPYRMVAYRWFFSSVCLNRNLFNSITVRSHGC